MWNDLVERHDIIIIGSVFGVLFAIILVAIAVLIRNHNRFLKRLRKLEDSFSANGYASSSWANPLKGANWAQRSGDTQPIYAPTRGRDLHRANNGRQPSQPSFDSPDFNLQDNFPIPQAGNINPLELIQGISDFEMPEGIPPLDDLVGFPGRSAMFPGGLKKSINPMFKNKRGKGENSHTQQNSNNRMFY